MSHYPPRGGGGGPERRGRGPPREYNRSGPPPPPPPSNPYYSSQERGSYRGDSPPRAVPMSSRDRDRYPPPLPPRDRDYRDSRGYGPEPYERDRYYSGRDSDRGREWGPGPSSYDSDRRGGPSWDGYDAYGSSRERGPPPGRDWNPEYAYGGPRGYPPSYNDRYPDRRPDDYGRPLSPPRSHPSQRDIPPRRRGRDSLGNDRRPRSPARSDHYSDARDSPQRRRSRSRSRSPITSPNRSPQNSRSSSGGGGRWAPSGAPTGPRGASPPLDTSLPPQTMSTDIAMDSPVAPPPNASQLPPNPSSAAPATPSKPASADISSTSLPTAPKWFPPSGPAKRAPNLASPVAGFVPTGPAQSQHALPTKPRAQQLQQPTQQPQTPTQKSMKDVPTGPAGFGNPPKGPKAQMSGIMHQKPKPAIVPKPDVSKTDAKAAEGDDVKPFDPLDPSTIPEKPRPPKSELEKRIEANTLKLQALEAKRLEQTAAERTARFDALVANLDKEHATWRALVAMKQRVHLEKGVPMEAFDDLEREGAFVGVFGGGTSSQGVGLSVGAGLGTGSGLAMM
ncbi:hypothetical protein DL93DRAFT_2172089 [Clavulina sp. PMI_390]|nr:hypothetical protein DL93DRAFT_2172089 [Clavulina sp. PMI_390]